MISLSRLACDRPEHGDRVRYNHDGSGICRVVVWNTTQACNLRCQHCYAACDGTIGNELSFEEGTALLDDLASAGVQVILLSGGEPLMRDRILDLVDHAASVGLRPVLSTNGMSMTPAIAARLAAAGLGYVGISLDGGRETHNAFRCSEKAYDGALAAVRYCQDAGLKVGLRFTLTNQNQHELPAVFDLLERENIPRICVYHLAYAGRGEGLSDEDQTHAEMRKTLTWLLQRTRQLHQAGNPVEVLTVDNRVVEGLYAAGRASAGLTRSGRHYASGMSIGGASFFGRMAGRQAAEAAISSRASPA